MTWKGLALVLASALFCLSPIPAVMGYLHGEAGNAVVGVLAFLFALGVLIYGVRGGRR